MPNNLAVLQKREEVRNDWEALEVSLVGLDFLSEREVVNFRDLSSVFLLAAPTVKPLVFFFLIPHYCLKIHVKSAGVHS